MAIRDLIRIFRLGRLMLPFLLLSAQPAQAHHSTAHFDFTIHDVIKGTVKVAEFRNPHSLVILEVTDENGKVKEREFAGHSLSHVRRAGLKYGMVEPGDEVTMLFAPERNGSGGYMRAMILPDGSVLNPLPTAISDDYIEAARSEYD